MSSKRYPSRLESRAGFFASTRDEYLSPRVRLECNPEIPVAPGEEHWLLDTSLDEVYWPFDNQTMAIAGMAPIFDNNRALFPELDEDALAAPDWYIDHCRPKLGRDFIITARGLLTDEIRADLEKLKGFQFANHPRIPINETRLELLSAIVQRQIGLILK